MESTTGMTDGFAIPHAKSAAITKPGIAFLKLTNPIDWGINGWQTSNL